MSSVKVAPLGERVLVKQDEEVQKTEGGIYLPETAKEAPQWGVVVRVGTGKVLDNGDVRPLTLKEGDKIIFGKYSGSKVKIGAEEYLFMKEEDILAVAE
jgi:chaperonin GroES